MNDPGGRVRRYLRSRADVPVPDDLRWPSQEDPRSPTTFRPIVRWAGLAASIGAAAVVVAAVVSGLGRDEAGPRPTSPLATALASPSSPVDAQFPATAAGMPVVSVGQAVELLQRGDLDGRAVAVAGYFFQEAFSCFSAPLRYFGPLEDKCQWPLAFTDDAASATLCTYGENSVSCEAPSGTYLAPFFMSETSGDLPFAYHEPTPLVLIGHSGDARQWQCAEDMQEACRRAFVVDRIAWANGLDVPLTAPETGDRNTGVVLAPRLTVDQAVLPLGLGDQVLAAAAFRAGDIAAVDPRWNLAGDDIMWIVRSIRGGDSSAVATRSVTVSLVDDATGELIDVHDLALSAGYRPARLWSIATTPGQCCVSALPFYRVRSNDGTTLHEGMVEGGAHGREDVTTYGPGVPLLLGPGAYSVTVWLASFDAGVIGPPTGDECSTEVALSELDDLMVEAVFPAAGQDCTFGQPSAPRLTY